jgi:hypothetical protein
MAAESLPGTMQAFIAQYIDSVEQLEILTLLGGNSVKIWTPAEIFKIIQSSEASVARCLAGLKKSGLLATPEPGHYQFPPREADLTPVLLNLLAAYRERRVSVIECIYAKPRAPVEDFADAFRLRKEK